MLNKKFWGTLLTTLLLSCGIPSFEYISVPIITSSTDTFSIEIDFTNSEEVRYFEIYSRYFPKSGKDSSELLDDITLSDIDSSAENFLVNNGFSIVKYSKTSTLSEENEGELEEKIDIPESSTNIIYTVTLDYDSNRVILNSSALSEDNFLLSTYNVTNESTHFIGDISDNLEEKLKKDFPEDYEEGQDVKIEFVVVNYGVSSLLTSIESLPVLVKNEFEIRP